MNTKYKSSASRLTNKARGKPNKSDPLNQRSARGRTMTKQNKPITPEEQAKREVAAMYGFIHPVDKSDSGGWVYDFDTDKYLDHNGEWVDDIEDDDITIPMDDLPEAVKIIKRVYPTHHIMSVIE